MEAAQARLSLHLLKYHIVGNHVPRLNYVPDSWILIFVSIVVYSSVAKPYVSLMNKILASSQILHRIPMKVICVENWFPCSISCIFWLIVFQLCIELIFGRSGLGF